MKIFHLLAFTMASAAIAASVTLGEVPQPVGARAVFEISDTVVVKDPPRFGANIEPPKMNHWNTEPWHNEWWLQPNPNPFNVQLKGIASGGSADYIEALPKKQGGNGCGIGFYDVLRDGFFDGGTAVVYRYENGKAQLLRAGTITQFKASADGENRAYFDGPGPAVRAGDEYVIKVVRRDIPPGSTRTMDGHSLLAGFGLEQQKEKAQFEAGVKMTIDPSAPPGGGQGSLKLTIPTGLAEPVRVGNWLFSGQVADWPRLHAGATYVCKMWLKQQGMSTGAVTVRVALITNQTFTVGTDWKEYSFELTGAPPKIKEAERFDIGTAEAGTLWIDNVSLYEKCATAPGDWYPEVVAALKEYRPGTLRIWALQANTGIGGRTLDDSIGPINESNLEGAELNGAKTSNAQGLHKQLELCAAVGADPWIIVSTLFSLQEHKNLIEYLAGPADSPYGKKRAAWGHPAPWTDTFKTIELELGNETWNSMFATQNFTGRAEQYGAYADLMFASMKSSPYFKADKFKLIVNGFAAMTSRKWGYGPRAIENCPNADAFDIAYYTGGWDAVGLIKAEDEATGWMNVLLFYQRMLKSRAVESKQVADEIASERGKPVGVYVYEAGPGYTLPAPGKFNRKEQEEGKSMAQAINAADSFMTNLRLGYGPQAFFSFKNGHYWSSHNRKWQPHIAWQALMMRNTLLQGDLVTAIPKEMVTLDLPEAAADIVSQSNSADRKVRKFPPLANVPLVDCYPFKDGKRYGYMLLSRCLTGAIPVTLELPYTPLPAVKLYKLSAPTPGANNIDDEIVKVEEETRADFAKTYTLTIPPFSVYVLVNEAK